MSDRSDGSFQGRSRDDTTGAEGSVGGTFLSDDAKWARLRDRLFVLVAIGAIITMLLTSYLVVQTNRQVQELNRGQVAVVQAQNDAQLCAQHDITLAVRKIGLKLGLPVEDIVPIDVSGLDCP